MKKVLLKAILAGLILSSLSGCILGNRPQFVRGGSAANQKTFYLDGAGNLGFGKETVPLGLEDGGYQGEVEHFIWTTYLGPVMDQVVYRYNRYQGRRLAERIAKHLDKYPQGNVNIIGLSAGSGVAVFALESLPSKYKVDNVVMLSSSLSASYDLGRALKRVRGGIYFFWSPDDPVLRGIIPIVGTVDRDNTGQPAGVTGARPPRTASAETRRAYMTQVRNIRWHPHGGVGPIQLRHAGTTDRTFVRHMVAPILVKSAPVLMEASPPAQAPLPNGSPATRPAHVY